VVEGWRFLSVIVMVAVLVTSTGSAAEASRGGLGVVTLSRVGPVRIGASTPADLRRFAGPPTSVSRIQPGTVRFELFYYRFPNHGYVYYWFANPGDGWQFSAFQSSLERFHTAEGTRAGMTLAESERRERGKHFRYHPAGCVRGLWRVTRDGWLAIRVEQSRVSALYVNTSGVCPV
jgi:hypothetical protein